MCAYPTTSNFCNAHEIFPLQVALARNDPIPRYISIYPPCIAKLYCFFREAKKKKRNADKVAISIDEATSVFYNGGTENFIIETYRNWSWSAALMSLRAASCHGGVLCPRLAFLQAQCGRCALDVTFFLPLSSFMLHRLNIQLDPKRRKLPAKQSHVYLTIVILSLVDRGKKRNVHIYFSTRIHGSGITFSLVTMQGNVASSVSI